MRRKPFREVTRELFQRLADRAMAQAEKSRGIFACLHDSMIAVPYEQERAMRLDRAGEMNLLALAVR
jgi:hypothetical protein